jgi:hypothetical protein
VAGALVPTVVAMSAFVTVAAPASAAPVLTQKGSPVVTESFTGTTVDGGWRALGDGCLTRATAAPAAPSALGACALRVGAPSPKDSTGYLQLTDATGWRKGGAVFTKASPSALGLDVTFDQWQYGTSNYGGDGLAFFVADGSASVTSAGGLGSSLGYAQNMNQPPAPNGIAGGYLGVGLDAHGTFSTSNDGHGTGCTTGQSPTQRGNAVVLRGPGSGKAGYCFLTATSLSTLTQKLRVTVTDPTVVTRGMARTFRVTVSPDQYPTVTVYGAFPAGTELKQVLQYKMTDAAPKSYQFGFTASAGSVTDAHLIGNVTASTVLPADTTPPVVTIKGGAAAVATTATPIVSGTSDEPAGSKVTVTVDDQKITATVQADGTWSVTPDALLNGDFKVSASATDPAGNVGTAAQQLTVKAPAAISISGGATKLTNQAKPTITGTSTALAGQTATVAVAGQKLTSVIAANGVWSVAPAALTQGPHPVVVTATAANGTKVSAVQTLTVDTVAPAIVITGGAAVSTPSATPTISGRTDAAAGSKVTVAVDGVTRDLVVSPTRTWSTTPDRLTAGSHAVVVTATDAAGNVGTQKQRLTVIPVLAIDGGSARLTNKVNPLISGTTDAPAGTTVTVTVGGQTLTGPVSAAGTWSVVPKTLSSAGYSVKATVRDAVGNVRTAWQNLTVDTIAPSIAIDGGSAVSTKSATPTVTGRVNVPAGATLKVVVDTVTHQVVVSATRTWSLTTQKLAPGVHSVAVFATDAAGNVGTQKQRLTVLK